MVDEDTGIWSFEDATHEWDGNGKGHSSCESLKPLLEKYLDINFPVIDMGCGLGDYINYLSYKGFEVYGFDGTPNIDECSIYHPVLEADLTKPIGNQINIPKGNVISLEVGEHIPKKYEEAFIDNLTTYCLDTLILSWAIPNQGGHGHYNEQTNDYVIRVVEKKGFVFDKEKTLEFRNELYNLIDNNRSDGAWSFFLNTIMIFRKIKKEIPFFEFGSLEDFDLDLGGLKNANIYVTSLYNWGNPSAEVKSSTFEMYELSRNSYFENLEKIDAHVLLINPGIDGELRGEDDDYHGDVFYDMFLKTYELNKRGHNVFYADIDTICVRPTKIFGMFNKFSMFNGMGAGVFKDKDPLLKWFPEVDSYPQMHEGIIDSKLFGSIQIPAYFNDGVRYFPAETPTSVWHIGFERWEDWKEGKILQSWGEQQIIHNMMLYEGQNWNNDYLILNRPDLNHFDLRNPQNLLDKKIYYYPFGMLSSLLPYPISIYHVFGSRGIREAIEIMSKLKNLPSQN